MAENGVEIAPAEGKLGILLVGLGAVSTTLVAGVEAVKRGRFCPACFTRRYCLRGVGYFHRQRIRLGDERRRAGQDAPGSDRRTAGFPFANARGIRAIVGQTSPRQQC